MILVEYLNDKAIVVLFISLHPSITTLVAMDLPALDFLNPGLLLIVWCLNQLSYRDRILHIIVYCQWFLHRCFVPRSQIRVSPPHTHHRYMVPTCGSLCADGSWGLLLWRAHGCGTVGLRVQSLRGRVVPTCGSLCTDGSWGLLLWRAHGCRTAGLRARSLRGRDAGRAGLCRTRTLRLENKPFRLESCILHWNHLLI